MNNIHKPNWVVTEVIPTEDYQLDLTFVTGERKCYDMRPKLSRKPFDALQNKQLFMQAKVVGPTVAWNDKIDIAPETLYEDGTPKTL